MRCPSLAHHYSDFISDHQRPSDATPPSIGIPLSLRFEIELGIARQATIFPPHRSLKSLALGCVILRG